MATILTNKNILLGITGSIAAFKSVELIRRLREVNANVRVVMTENAKQFITPLTFQAVSGNPIHQNLFDLEAEAAMGHIELSRWADFVLIAPASASCITKLALGEANDLLSTLCLATKTKIAVAPAMNQGMWSQVINQENIQRLSKCGVQIWGPNTGPQACGDIGYGRMLEPEELITHLEKQFQPGSLTGFNVLISAGPTQEAIDPVRFISNHSSGKMGYALAQAAVEAGANVTLVSGPVALKPPDRITFKKVITALEMYDRILSEAESNDIFISVAAVADYRCETIAQQKIRKQSETLTLKLIRNPDIVSAVAQIPKKPFIVGFAAETENLIAAAEQKRKAKQMDMIIANLVSHQNGFGCDDNEVYVLNEQHQIHLSLTSKSKLARKLINLIAENFKMRIL